MKTLLVCIILVILTHASGCTSTQAPREASQSPEASQGIAVHSCSKNPFLRSVGLFGGEQPEFFSSGPDIRREAPPSADHSTRFLNVTHVDNLSDPIAQPAIDRCGSWLQATGEGEIEVTIRWYDRSCPESFDDENQDACYSRARFTFLPEDLGIQEALVSSQDPNAALRRLLLVDAYFIRENQFEGRHPTSGVLATERSDVYLVVRVMRAGPMVDPNAATTMERKPTSRVGAREASI
jgi:hypothetical protein